ncbi:SHOCT domain-containing protein [Pseudonocardia abyssalis]|jgi:putative membrane protein|uniref:SHOCT domain-containing protein n=1 Tax=Pseudonocardia abyssalis TaxID=2792008 RepID=A0ABS6US13_9PSEU|nr:SHOCT domain-containing protein [Pseudonocardia abyssalis]MBW0114562.1 SHOCT domain-containing protein [Pseudonocardia abyssalis]MBW0135039.1 SHOCT domain-containing protein [Pseudonocardia abyssalis]
MPDMDMMGGGMMAAMGIWALVLIATVLAILVAAVLASIWLVRRLRHDRTMLRDGTDAADILQRRYAAGEIDDDEYQRRRSTLSRP